VVKIGVFDSGVGGKSVANAIERALPDDEVVYVDDAKNVPYGTKTPDELFKLVMPLLNMLSKQGCDAIVIACNTVSTTIIDKLRAEFTIPLVAMEPMVKPASKITKSKTVAICATPTTLASSRYKWLKKEFAQGITVLEPDCSDWSYLIEANQVNKSHIEKQINKVCEQGADVIVLGCTHYHWIEDIITEVANGRATILQPEQAVISQVSRVLGVDSRH
jgi:glutamate racemase